MQTDFLQKIGLCTFFSAKKVPKKLALYFIVYFDTAKLPKKTRSGFQPIVIVYCFHNHNFPIKHLAARQFLGTLDSEYRFLDARF